MAKNMFWGHRRRAVGGPAEDKDSAMMMIATHSLPMPKTVKICRCLRLNCPAWGSGGEAKAWRTTSCSRCPFTVCRSWWLNPSSVRHVGPGGGKLPGELKAEHFPGLLRVLTRDHKYALRDSWFWVPCLSEDSFQARGSMR